MQSEPSTTEQIQLDELSTTEQLNGRLNRLYRLKATLSLAVWFLLSGWWILAFAMNFTPLVDVALGSSVDSAIKQQVFMWALGAPLVPLVACFVVIKRVIQRITETQAELLTALNEN